MFKNYLKTAMRNLLKNKVYSAINMLSLSVGVACCMLIFLYAKDEVTFDQFYKNKENIFRITTTMTPPEGEASTFGSTGMMQGPAFKKLIPEVEDFVRLQAAGFTVKNKGEVFDQIAMYVDENFFSVFSQPLLYGNPKTALHDMHSLVISEKLAEKYFGRTDVVGQELQMNTGKQMETFVIGGVAKNSPQNSSIRIEMLASMKFKESQEKDENWINFYLNTFLVLKPGSDVKKVETKIAQVFAAEAASDLKEMREKYNDHNKIRFSLQALTAMHLSTDFVADNGLSGASNPMYAYILSGIAAFILLIACINFVNLTVARSLKRAKEIGVRKVIGSSRKQLVIQFLGESFILSFFAFLFALLLSYLALPVFNKLADKELSLSYLFDIRLVAGYVGLFLISGLLAGFYPALVLSKFKPVDTLYGKLRLSGKDYLSKGMIVFQFALSTFLIIATITIYSQFVYLTGFDLGIDTKNVVTVQTPSLDAGKLAVFKQELQKDPGVLLVTADQGGNWNTMANVNGETQIDFNYVHTDEKYVPVFHLPIVKGRNFSKEIISDSVDAVLVNESFVKKAGWTNPIGQVVDFFYDKKKYYVIGVVKDYNFEALTQKVKPQLLRYNSKNHYRKVYLKIAEGNRAGLLSHIQKTFKSLYPNDPYYYEFKDDSNRENYEKESKWRQIVSFSALLAIFISCMGLFGLSALSAEKRAKEIGIRKVFGATVAVIARRLSGDFVKLVLIAALIALPAAWWAMNKWLENYPYRIELNVPVFLFSILSVLLVALITVSFQSIKAAMSNPVKNLRTE
jgi:putative ABC transport system permease protein